MSAENSTASPTEKNPQELAEHEAARKTEHTLRDMVTEVIDMAEGNARAKRNLEHKDIADASETVKEQPGESHELTQQHF